MVEVLIPWRSGCPHREAALEWVQARFAAHHPDWTVSICTCPSGPWSKAVAIDRPLRASSADVVVVADADVWTDGFGEAVRAIVCGAASWAVPHRRVHRLTEVATAKVLAGEAPDPLPVERTPYVGIEGGGSVVAQPQTLLDVPLDPRYEGWGQEDASWGFALWLLEGQPWRPRHTPLFHLWHPLAPRTGPAFGSRRSRALYKRYLEAKEASDPEAMRALIAEGQARPFVNL